MSAGRYRYELMAAGVGPIGHWRPLRTCAEPRALEDLAVAGVECAQIAILRCTDEDQPPRLMTEPPRLGIPIFKGSNDDMPLQRRHRCRPASALDRRH